MEGLGDVEMCTLFVVRGKPQFRLEEYVAATVVKQNHPPLPKLLCMGLPEEPQVQRRNQAGSVSRLNNQACLLSFLLTMELDHSTEGLQEGADQGPSCQTGFCCGPLRREQQVK